MSASFERFKFYAARVKEMDFHDVSIYLHYRDAWATLISSSNSSTFFPHLRKLRWRFLYDIDIPASTKIAYLDCFLTSSLTYFEMDARHATRAHNDVPDDYEFAPGLFHTFLAALPARCPRLRTLSFNCDLSAAAFPPAAFSALQNLTSLTLPTDVRDLSLEALGAAMPAGVTLPSLLGLEFGAPLSVAKSVLASPYLPHRLTRLCIASIEDSDRNPADQYIANDICPILYTIRSFFRCLTSLFIANKVIAHTMPAAFGAARLQTPFPPSSARRPPSVEAKRKQAVLQRQQQGQ